VGDRPRFADIPSSEEDMDPQIDSIHSGEATPESPTAWRLPIRLLFRFGVLYFLLYSHVGFMFDEDPFPLNWLPNPTDVRPIAQQEWPWVQAAQEHFYQPLESYNEELRALQYRAVDWTAAEVFDLDRQLERPLGSGDTTHSHIEVLLYATAAAIGCLLWSLLDLRRSHYRKLSAWAFLGLRYYLAHWMIVYGMVKVIKLQFPDPMLDRLLTPYGESSPMNLVWTFMGYSEPYTIFAGAGEVLGGLLLLFRRTTTFGALVSAAVMSNVMVLNYSYDVPVKLFSTHLVIGCGILLIPDTQRLLSVFILNRAAPQRDLQRPQLGWVGHVVRLVCVATLLYVQVDQAWQSRSQYGNAREKPPLFGIWDVEEYTLNGEVVPPLTSDPVRWQNLIVDYPGYALVRRMDDLRHGYGFAVNQDAKTVTMTAGSSWNYSLPDGDTLVFKGEFSHYVRAHPGKPASEDPPIPTQPQVSIRMVKQAPETKPEGNPDTGLAGEPSAPQSALVGTWNVISIETIGDVLGLRRSDPSGWKTLVVDSEGVAQVQFDNDRTDTYAFVVDESAQQAIFSTGATLSLEQPEDDTLILRGDFRGHELVIRLSARDLSGFLLVRRGFHWINEIPLNR
jgi:uncharacterized membrane protein YphA (DoxX/SURF4 family)